jgi:glycosyltransferase involved in cell wall biosynthesis
MVSDTIEFSGAERAIVNLARALASTKHVKILLLTTRFLNTTTPRLPFERSFIISKKKPISIKELYSILLNPVIFMKTLHYFLHVADDFQPDVVHSGVFLSLIWSTIISRKMKIPLVAHVHDYRFLCLTDLPFVNGVVSQIPSSLELKYYLDKTNIYSAMLAMGLRRLILQFLNRADLILAVSNFVKNKIQPFLKPPIKVVYNLVDTPVFKYEKFNDTINIVYSARLSFSKGIHIFLRAVKSLVKDTRVRIHITGFGELEPLVRQYSSKYEKSIIFHGFLPKNLLQELIGRSHLTVHPSLWPEPFSLSIIESVNLGTPAIASNRGGNPEILPSHYLFEPEAEQLRAKILSFMMRPEDYPPILAINLDANCIVNTLIEFYQRILKTGKKEHELFIMYEKE